MKSDFKLKAGQQAALDKFKDFIQTSSTRIFILKGYAGTGKTTLLRMLVKELTERECNFKLLASTGRAAKIVSNITGAETKTDCSQFDLYLSGIESGHSANSG